MAFYPTGTALTVTIITIDTSGAVYDPSPLPTIIYARQPDGTVVTPVALAHPAVGTFTATVFSASDNASEGTYQMGAYTSDADDGNGGWYRFEWDVNNTLAAIQAQTDTITSGSVTVSSPVTSSQLIEIVRGDDYYLADGRQIAFTLSGGPSIVGATVTLIIRTDPTPFVVTCTVTSATACYAELTSAQTLANFGPGLSYGFDLQAVLATSSHVVTLVQGTLSVAPDVRA